MNKANLKSYAPKARIDFIAAVTARANLLGISASGALPADVRGGVAIIDGREWPAKVAGQRDELIARIQRHGFEQTMDEVAYTWFNRFAALRYMEIHEYLDHGWRVLSSRDGGLPEILRHASEVSLSGLNAARAREMQMAGNQDNELYKLLLVAQCNELSRVMPFLFERIDDETELLLPENLLRTDSIVAKLVESVPEEDWQEIEVIGWLYQFYISEKKDLVMGKVVKSEDIPAATQLFTPNWIVQYLVQNSVGRLWLMANPTSTLASQWPYYIQPAEQTPEVQAQLDALIQTRIREDGETLNPETITVLDPACGSGHILVVAYDVLKAIYLERGYQLRAIPRLILEKNLYGLDIDDRAGQLAAFALLMKARADDRRLFREPLVLNVLSLRESNGLDVDELTTHLTPFGLHRASLKALIDILENAKTFGSLIQIPTALGGQLLAMTNGLQDALNAGDLYAQHAAKEVLPLTLQALLLATKFDAVVANPPYMGSNVMNALVKRFTSDNFPDAKSDLFACFIRRGGLFAKRCGHSSMITMDGWMFLSSYADLREALLHDYSVNSLVHVGWNCFPEVHTYHRGVAFTLFNGSTSGKGQYLNLSNVAATAEKGDLCLSRISTGEELYSRAGEDFKAIPGSPFAYWVSDAVYRVFAKLPRAASLVCPREGLATGNNERYVRAWTEVAFTSVGFGFQSRNKAKKSQKRWFPYNKGGDYRKWSGNNLYVVDWLNDGFELQNSLHPSGSRIWAHNFNLEYIFRPFVTWSDVTSKGLTMRIFPSGYLFDATGLSAFAYQDGDLRTLRLIAALGNSIVGSKFSQILNPTLHFKSGNFADLPVDSSIDVSDAEGCFDMARSDWDAYERSWEFQCHPILTASAAHTNNIEYSYLAWIAENREVIAKMKRLEEANNRQFVEAYGLAGELSSEVALEQVTLTVNPAFRFGGKLNEEGQWIRFRQETVQELISYIVGCTMGRYSLEEPGLIYAQAGNNRFDPDRYGQKFPAVDDGILPITDVRWFEDDAASRVREFVQVGWGSDMLEQNLAWVAMSLGVKGSETPDETIRRYSADAFYKDHLQTYKKRPIYWLFSSGKHGAFEALVYLHRYNEGTLARMRSEYVMPLIAKIAARLQMLDEDVAAAASASARTKLQKQIESMRKKQIELLAYDEKLRHYADMRITLDLDDGVKVNYAKFGDLVAESKAITGGSDD